MSVVQTYENLVWVPLIHGMQVRPTRRVCMTWLLVLGKDPAYSTFRIRTHGKLIGVLELNQQVSPRYSAASRYLDL